MSDASKSEDGGTGEATRLGDSRASVLGSSFADLRPRWNVRFRRALTGARSPALPVPDEVDSRGGTLRPVKCSIMSVYGERVKLEWLRVARRETALRPGLRTILGSCSEPERKYPSGGEPNRSMLTPELKDERRVRVMCTSPSSDSAFGGVTIDRVRPVERELRVRVLGVNE